MSVSIKHAAPLPRLQGGLSTPVMFDLRSVMTDVLRLLTFRANLYPVSCNAATYWAYLTLIDMKEGRKIQKNKKVKTCSQDQI